MNTPFPTQDFQVPVTQAHIEASTPCNANHCAINIAIEAYIHAHVHTQLLAYTTQLSITIYDTKDERIPEHTLTFQNNSDLKIWIRNYDNTYKYRHIPNHQATTPVEPIQIHFDLKEQVATLIKEPHPCEP